jgi:glutamyl-tRNA reductase
VTAGIVADAMATRPERPMVLVDLAVPRDIEAACGGIVGVTLFDIAALRARVTAYPTETAADIARAHELVREEVGRWVSRRRGDELSSVIRALRRHGEDVVQGELERVRTRLAGLDADERAAVEAALRGVAAKLLHDPIVGLKERVEPSREREVAALLAELLGLPETP